MVKYLNNISEVNSYYLKNNTELISLNDNSILINNEKILTNAPYFDISDDNFYFITTDKSVLKYNIQTKKITSQVGYYPTTNTIGEEYLRSSISDYDSENNCFWSNIIVISSISNEILYSTKSKYNFFHSLWLGKNYIFTNTTNLSLLTNLEIKTETTLWQYSVAELGADKVSRILGVFGQMLVVVCEMPKNPKSILVGLDITDGSKLFTVPLTLYQMNNNLFFYEANNSIVSIIGEYLWEFSLSTFQVIREKYLPEVFNTEDVHMQVYLATLQGDSIYFAASEFGKSMSSAIVGIFDLKKEQLIDYIDLKPNGKFCMGGNSCPQVSGNKIYVLDTKKTLHILEREDG